MPARSRPCQRVVAFVDLVRAVSPSVVQIEDQRGLGSSAPFRQGVEEAGSTVTLPFVIQTSAAINPRELRRRARRHRGPVIGVPTLAATDPQLGGSAPGIGFAIPSNLVTDIAGQILAHGSVVSSHRAFLGVRVGETNGAARDARDLSRRLKPLRILDEQLSTPHAEADRR
jgi:S1-C subfamily serine protease